MKNDAIAIHETLRKVFGFEAFRPDQEEIIRNIISGRALFAVDEAHCISEWGHDFRPDYLGLSRIAREFSQTPITAFTATATQKVQDDIVEKLGLRSPFLVRASFIRPNLFYEVRPKTNLELQILDFLLKHKGESGIVYRTTRDSVTETAEFLSSNGFSALPYHAGLPAGERSVNQEAFNKDEAQIIVATIAFGMGIDKSNVRFVIHADLPKNIENYYQETGRAGRDGEPAHCLLFFSRGDIPKIRYFIDQSNDDDERSMALEKLHCVVAYAEQAVCRRRRLLRFFGEEYPSGNCGNCDVCTGTVETSDITRDAQIIMSAISRTGQGFGAGHIVDIVTGADTKKMRELKHHGIKTFGSGKDRKKDHWRFIVNELLAQELLVQEGRPYPVLRITSKGLDVLYGRAEAISVRLKVETDSGERRSGYDEDLFGKLRELRKRLAEAHDVPPYVIFSDRSLHDMCRSFPVMPSEMRRISGVGDKKLEQYGEGFMSVIRNYLKENPGASEAVTNKKDSPIRPAKKAGRTAEETYNLFMSGLLPEEIAQRRGLAVSTISSHLEQLILDGREMEMDRIIEPEKREKISDFFRSSGRWELNPVVEHFKGTVSYEEARMVRAWIRQKG